MKKFSIGSKKKDAKQININLNKNHLRFAGVFFIVALLFHMFVYSPYLEYELKMVCSDKETVIIEDNMTSACGIILPYNMTGKQIYNYLGELQREKEFEVMINE